MDTFNNFTDLVASTVVTHASTPIKNEKDEFVKLVEKYVAEGMGIDDAEFCAEHKLQTVYQHVDEFKQKIQPLFQQVIELGNQFKEKKEAYIAEFKNRGIPFNRETSSIFDALSGRKKVGSQRTKITLSAVQEMFPNVPRKELQALAKFVGGEHSETYKTLDAYLQTKHDLMQKADKWKDIYDSNLPETDPELDRVYEDLYDDLETLDDSVRAGLK